ncbi:hypothetical protein AS200_44830 (plasmid) [Streptomyces sp. CdTB01]|nr:hypothetical protein AS200_44830 [Streptomyces sp. CdTB01]
MTVPVIVDRCLQAVALGALEPEWKARFEPKSYGFRPGRGCHDAIGAIYSTLNGKNPQRVWVLDADLTAAFDRIDHDRLMAALGTFPARGTGPAVAEGGGRGPRPVRPDRGGNSTRRSAHASNAMGNFTFEVTLRYRRLEKLPRGESRQRHDG